jgi:hypothetical protein
MTVTDVIVHVFLLYVTRVWANVVVVDHVSAHRYIGASRGVHLHVCRNEKRPVTKILEPRYITSTRRMFGTKSMTGALLVVCLLSAAGGAAVASQAGMQAPLRILSSLDMQRVANPSPGASVSGAASGAGIAGHDRREMGGLARAMQRSTSHTRRLNTIEDHVVMHASHDNSVYEPVKQRRWGKSPAMAPPLHMDRPDGEFTYIQAKLYPHMSF